MVFVENCGLGFWAVDYNKRFEKKNGTIICTACKSGYSPTYEDGFITSCDPIDFCTIEDDQRRFNGCYKCNENYAL